MAQKAERRKSIRRLSDDCSQCDIWSMEIAQHARTMEKIEADNKEAIEVVHKRIDNTLPWKVFLVVVAVYLGLAGYNAMAIKNLSIDFAKVETKIEGVEKSIAKVERSIGR